MDSSHSGLSQTKAQTVNCAKQHGVLVVSGETSCLALILAAATTMARGGGERSLRLRDIVEKVNRTESGIKKFCFVDH